MNVGVLRSASAQLVEIKVKLFPADPKIQAVVAGGMVAAGEFSPLRVTFTARAEIGL